jgi:hypothetical protein
MGKKGDIMKKMILFSLLAVSAGQLFAAEALDQLLQKGLQSHTVGDLKKGIQSNTLDTLINAITSGDNDEVKRLLVAGIELEVLNAHDGVFSPLGAALASDNKVAEELLRNKGATVVVDNYNEFIEKKSLPQKPTFMSQEEWDRSASE